MFNINHKLVNSFNKNGRLLNSINDDDFLSIESILLNFILIKFIIFIKSK